MNKKETTAAADNYREQFKQDPEQTKEAIMLDFEKTDADAIIAELVKTEKPASKADQTKTAKGISWYDEFDVRISKKEVRNPLANKLETIITGWYLEKKKHPKCIEPHVALSLNAFANGYQTDSAQPYLILKDTMKSGDFLPYKTWATEQGINLLEDINILLNQNPS